jgi:hypothetical protein
MVDFRSQIQPNRKSIAKIDEPAALAKNAARRPTTSPDARPRQLDAAQRAEP